MQPAAEKKSHTNQHGKFGYSCFCSSLHLSDKPLTGIDTTTVVVERHAVRFVAGSINDATSLIRRFVRGAVGDTQRARAAKNGRDRVATTGVNRDLVTGIEIDTLENVNLARVRPCASSKRPKGWPYATADRHMDRIEDEKRVAVESVSHRDNA